MEDRTALLDAVRASAARFAASVSALTETQARGPSALPGWSRAHVVTGRGGPGVSRATRYRAGVSRSGWGGPG